MAVVLWGLALLYFVILPAFFWRRWVVTTRAERGLR